jgi:hypothetical protein
MFSFSYNSNIRQNNKINLHFNKTELMIPSDKIEKIFEENFIVKIFKNEIINLKSYFEEKYKIDIDKYIYAEETSKKLHHFLEFFNGEKCSNENCENNNGICIKKNICLCKLGFGNLKQSKIPCNFKESFQKYALILELIFPIGIGHFYCSRNLIGSIKLIVLLFIPMFFVILFNLFLNSKKEKNVNNEYNYEKDNDNNESNYYSFLKKLFFLSYFIVFVSWFLYDMFMFSGNIHKDGWGYDLIKY